MSALEMCGYQREERIQILLADLHTVNSVRVNAPVYRVVRGSWIPLPKLLDE